jgi:putative colanic acid biosynthesis acetyltransferase WcaF
MIIQGADPFVQPSFSLNNRLARAIWGFVFVLFFRFSPRPFHLWRRIILRLFGAKIGHSVHVYPKVNIWAPWLLEISDRVGIANGVTLYNMAQIYIGGDSVISQGAHLCCGTHDINSPNFQLVAKSIKIDRHTWIGAEAFIGPGVSIAEGCVVGARAVVTKNILEPWTVWVGNPAFKKKQRAKIMGMT